MGFAETALAIPSTSAAVPTPSTSTARRRSSESPRFVTDLCVEIDHVSGDRRCWYTERSNSTVGIFCSEGNGGRTRIRCRQETYSQQPTTHHQREAFQRAASAVVFTPKLFES